MSELLIQAKGIGKRYPLVNQRGARLSAVLRLLAGRPGTNDTHVLRPMDLDIHRGQSLGVIGENGAGKSTLLKLLTGVLTPSSGQVVRHGTVGALLELGAGFHPEYSGIENVRMSAALHGLSPAQIRQRLPEIVEFADIGDYVQQPVKNYSSGMVVRLGFAVVAALRPDLIITDEILAVGDESFQKKCIAWMEDYLAGGGTLLLVSHGMYHIQRLCRHAIWLHKGEVQARGDAFDVTQAYLAHHERKARQADGSVSGVNAEYRIERWRINGIDDPGQAVVDGDPGALDIEVDLHAADDRPPTLLLGLAQAAGLPLYGVSSEMEGVSPQRLAPTRYRHRVRLDVSNLLPGEYLLKLHPLDQEGLRVFGTQEITVVVRGATRELGTVRFRHQWGD